MKSEQQEKIDDLVRTAAALKNEHVALSRKYRHQAVAGTAMVLGVTALGLTILPTWAAYVVFAGFMGLYFRFVLKLIRQMAFFATERANLLEVIAGELANRTGV